MTDQLDIVKSIYEEANNQILKKNEESRRSITNQIRLDIANSEDKTRQFFQSQINSLRNTCNETLNAINKLTEKLIDLAIKGNKND